MERVIPMTQSADISYNKEFSVHNEIVNLAHLINVAWHDRQNRVILKNSEGRRILMFRINNRDQLVRVYINDLILHSNISFYFINMTTSHERFDQEQYSKGFHNAYDFTFISFIKCINAIKSDNPFPDNLYLLD